MSQYLRPDSTTRSVLIASGTYTDIDESSVNTADYVQTNSLTKGGSSAYYRCGLSNPGGTPSSGTSTLRLWMGKVSGSAATAYMHWRIYQGTTLIVSGTQQVGTIGFTVPYEFAPNLSAVSDWNNLAVETEFYVPSFVSSGTDATMRLFMVELEVPDSGPSGDLSAAENPDTASFNGIGDTGTLAATEAPDSFSGTGLVGAIFSATEIPDSLTGTGIVAAYSGPFSASEAPDTFSASNILPQSQYGSRFICSRCGFHYPKGELRREWTGSLVCHPCFDPKPSDLKPPKVKPEGVPDKNSNPEPTITFVGINENTRASL